MAKQIYWPYIVLSYLGLFSLGVIDNSRGPFFPELLADLKLSNTYGSFFFVIPSTFSFVGSTLAPKIVKKWGVLRGQQIGLIAMCLSFAIMSVCKNFEMLLIVAAFFGTSFGILAVTQHLIIQEGSGESDWRQLFSGLHSMYALASLTVPILVSYLISQGFSWRIGFLTVSCVGLVVVLSSLSTKSLKVQSLQKKSHQGFKWTYFYMGAAISLYIVGELVVSTRFVQYMRSVHNVSADRAPLYLSLFFLFLLFGRLTFSFKKFSFSNRQIILSCLLLSALFSFLGLYVSPYFLAMSGLFMGPIFAVNMNYLAEVFQKESSTAIASVMAYSAFYVLSMHFGVGYLTDVMGIQKALLLGPICLVVSFIMIYIRPRVFSKIA